MSLEEIHSHLHRVDESSARDGSCFTCIDVTRNCMSCSVPLVNSMNNGRTTPWKGIRRTSNLHTFAQGTVGVTVVDLICEGRNQFHAFDERDNAVFSVSKEHTFISEVLDFWIWEVCGQGKTFRQAFSTLMAISIPPRIKFQLKGLQLTCNRRLCSSAFLGYLPLLDFMFDEALSTTLSSSFREQETADSSNCIDSVVMDGSAYGL